MEATKTAMPCTLRIGEEIVYTRNARMGTPFKNTVVAVYQVERVTKTQLVAKRTFGAYGDPVMRFRAEQQPNTPEQIAAAKAEFQWRREENDRRKAAAAREMADPKYLLLQRLKSGGDFEPWGKLTLDQLQTIAGWLDAVRDGTPE